MGDGEVKDGFSMMRVVGLNQYVCQGKTQSEVAPGRNCVPKLRPRSIPSSVTFELPDGELEGTEELRLAHFSVKEYLTSERI